MSFFSKLKDLFYKISEDRISDYASSACYYILLSFLPFLLALMSMIRLLPISSNDFVDFFEHIIPSQLKPMLLGIVSDVYDHSSTTLTIVTSAALIWAAGMGFTSIIRGLKVIYGYEDNQNWILQRIFACLYALVFMVIILLTLLFLIYGNSFLTMLTGFLPTHNALIVFLSSILETRRFLFPIIFISFFTFLYCFIAKRTKKLYHELPGAIFSATGWYLFSKIYSIYVSLSSNFSYMYGSLTTFIFALIWMYFCIQILFYGAEVNVFLQKNFFKSKKANL